MSDNLTLHEWDGRIVTAAITEEDSPNRVLHIDEWADDIVLITVEDTDDEMVYAQITVSYAAVLEGLRKVAGLD